MKHQRHRGLQITAALFVLYLQAAPAIAEAPISIFAKAIAESSARGELTGPRAEKMKGTTRSNAPIYMRAKVVKRFAQEGCARLAIQLTQADVPTRGGQLMPFETEWEMNMCADGSPPPEGRNPAAAEILNKPTGLKQ